MGLRERLTQVTQFFHKARTEGRKLMDEDARQAASAEERVGQREERRLDGMTAEDRAWEQASLQRNRERHARSGESTISSNDRTISE